MGVPPESAFVALDGILVGTALSLVTSSLLFCNDDLQGVGVPFLIPRANIALLAAASGAASLTTAWPARRRPGQAGGALGIAD